MRLYFLFVATALACTACSSPSYMDEDAVNQFQSLTKNQQAHYWQQKQLQYASAQIEQLGGQVLINGEEYQIKLPAKLFFVGQTPIQTSQGKQAYPKIVDLLNAEPTSSVVIEAYASTGDTQRDFDLTNSWAHTVMNQLRDRQLNVALVHAQGRGKCLSYPNSDPLAARIEIHFRIQQVD